MGMNTPNKLAGAIVATAFAISPAQAKTEMEKVTQNTQSRVAELQADVATQGERELRPLNAINTHVGVNHQQGQAAPMMGVSVGKGNVAFNAGGTAGKEYNNGFLAGGVAGDAVYGMGSVSASRGKYGVRGYGASAEVGVVPDGSVVHHAEGHVIHHEARDKQIGENVFFEGGHKTTVGGSVGFNTTVNGVTNVGVDHTKRTFGKNETIGWVSHTEYLSDYDARVGVSGATNGEVSVMAQKDLSSRVTGFVNAGTNVKHHGGNFVMAGVRVALDGKNPSVGSKPVSARDVMHDRVMNLHAGSPEVVQNPVELGQLRVLEEVQQQPQQPQKTPEQIRREKEEAMQKELEEVVKQIPGDVSVVNSIDNISTTGWYTVAELQNLPQGARFEDLKVVGETQQQRKDFDLFVKAEGNKILYTMTEGAAEDKGTITGKIVYEKDGVRQEKEFTTIVRLLNNFI
ncbi:hypothetical protein BLM37_02245 [Candidatus Gracilibacteria bacterium GN02-873]|nr:hypothetical protein BLM37_02245 [Candidatus Gracilibacteria bacterium GN02-873]